MAHERHEQLDQSVARVDRDFRRAPAKRGEHEQTARFTRFTNLAIVAATATAIVTVTVTTSSSSITSTGIRIADDASAVSTRSGHMPIPIALFHLCAERKSDREGVGAS